MDREKSKRLSYVLRHHPESAGLTLDVAGWADVHRLMANMGFNPTELSHEVLTNSKQRFEFSDDGMRIRACQGHSVDVDLGLREQQPPIVLFHGTCEDSLPGIREEGIKAMSRRQVHLSTDRETAQQVGARHGAPVVLSVQSLLMCVEGYRFYLSTNGVWLTDSVPSKFINFGPRRQPSGIPENPAP